MSQIGFAFPAPLSEKYRPRKIEDFAGLEKPKKIVTPTLTEATADELRRLYLFADRIRKGRQ